MKSLRELFKRLPNDGKLRHTLRNFNIGMMRPGRIQSVKELAEALGLDVYQVDMSTRMAGRLVSDSFSQSGFAIEVNRQHSVESRRFTVLHEIGHFLLHTDQQDPLFDPLHLNRGEDEFYVDLVQEREANDVADILLFGDGALEAALSLHGGDLKTVARYFGVSAAVLMTAKRKYGLVEK